MKKMFLQRIQEGLRFTAFLLLCLPALATMAASGHDNPPAKDIRNIVLVHGAFADGSGYKALFNILTAKGYHVTVVQNPLTSLKDDVAATQNILDKQDGPCVLVGHSWGGTVITEAGTHPKVAALVYIAAFQPDKGESTAQLAGSGPATDPSGILPPDDKGIIYFDVAQFHNGFSADLPIETSNFMAASQVPIFAACFGAPVSQVAWKNRPSYGIVATDDHALHPDIQRRMYKRAGDHITEIKGSHAVFISQPEAVANVIIAATQAQR
ncbi:MULTISPECIES: alpha/beta fold hydrolase [Chitinophaga]|uniref:alpha/beta fold hydrolase n=1 Tax=Chitinophaga TaxID=79328 RepID=UPI001FFD8BA2|nr:MULTISPECIES: alpha/beta hydrolase [Chitinophaga]